MGLQNKDSENLVHRREQHERLKKPGKKNQDKIRGQALEFLNDILIG